MKPLTLNYDLRLKLATSFTGKDQLTTVLRSGNFNDSIFGTGLTFVETAMSSGNSVKVGRLFYTFPVGDSLSVTAGPIVRTDDASMYAGYATYYPSDLLLDFFTYGGAPTTNNLGFTGSGVGAVYTIGDSGFSVSGNYVANNGADSSVASAPTSLLPPLLGSCSTRRSLRRQPACSGWLLLRQKRWPCHRYQLLHCCYEWWMERATALLLLGSLLIPESDSFHQHWLLLLR